MSFGCMPKATTKGVSCLCATQRRHGRLAPPAGLTFVVISGGYRTIRKERWSSASASRLKRYGLKSSGAGHCRAELVRAVKSGDRPPSSGRSPDWTCHAKLHEKGAREVMPQQGDSPISFVHRHPKEEHFREYGDANEM